MDKTRFKYCAAIGELMWPMLNTRRFFSCCQT